MLTIGDWNELTISRFKDFGAYLTDGQEDVLLPKSQVPKGAKVGDSLTCFLYRDSDDRLIATLQKPYLTAGEIACLTVKDVTGIGAFLDCGLERDLFLPYKEQTVKVVQGKIYPVRMYVDKTGRLAASMRLYDHLATDHHFRKGDHAKGVVYQVRPGFGALVAVENRYSGLIHASELYDRVTVGDQVEVRIVSVRQDGKLDLALRDAIPEQMKEDAQMVLDVIRSYGGTLPFTDKADPERIKAEFGLSKNAFKRAVGRLLKEGKVRILEKSIEMTEE